MLLLVMVVKVGCQVQLIKRQAQFQNCKWVHVVHTASEDLSKYKGYGNPISKGEEKLWDEVDRCKCADLVVPVEPKLEKAYHGYKYLTVFFFFIKVQISSILSPVI